MKQWILVLSGDALETTLQRYMQRRIAPNRIHIPLFFLGVWKKETT